MSGGYKKWDKLPLINVATLQRGFDLPVKQRVAGQVPIFAANGPVGTHNVGKIAGPGVVTGRSGTIGKVHYIQDDYWPLNTSLFVKDFHGNHPRFVYYLLKWMRLERFHQGTGVPTLNRNNIHDIPIYRPPLAEQKRIAAILDKADAIRRKRQQAIQLTSQFLRSTFLDMFGDPRINPKGWPKRKLGEVVELDAPMVDPREAQYLDLLHIGPDRIEKCTGRILSAATAREDQLISGKFLFDERFVLYSKIRPYLRKVAIPSFRGLCSADVYPIRPATKQMNREFLFSLLISEAFLDYTAQLPSRASIPKLNRKELARYSFPIPPIELQDEFAKTSWHIAETKLRLSRHKQSADNLFNSLVQRAFRGEL